MAEPDHTPSEAAQAAHRAFHEAWGGPNKSLDLYVDSPLWERIAEAVATQVGTPERYAHFVYDPAARDAAMEAGTPVTAVCGKVWVPSREPFHFPLCPTCAIEALRNGWMA